MEKAIDLARQTGDRIGESLWLSSLGLTLGLVGHYDRAVDCVNAAIAATERAAGDPILSTHLSYLIRLALEFERPDEAQQHITRCREALERHPDPSIETRVMFYRAWVRVLRREDPASTARDLEQALYALEQTAPDEEAQSGRVLLAQMEAEAGDLPSARARLAPLLARHGESPEVAVPQRARLVQSLLAWKAGNLEEAREALEGARDLIMEAAGRLHAPDDRDAYLRDVPLNRRILLKARAGSPL